MKAAELVDRAREEHAAGRQKAALRQAWEAVQAAMYAQDEGPVRDIELLARDIAAASDGGTRSDAGRLAAYCAALLDGVGGGVSAPGFFERMLGSVRLTGDDRRRPCPECAERIKVDAKVCRYCGHRLDGSDG